MPRSQYLSAYVALLAGLAHLILPLTASAKPPAGTLEGAVTEIPDNGRYLMLEVTTAVPEGLAESGSLVKVMANWAQIDGKAGPRPSEVEQIRGYQVGQAIQVTVRRDAKHGGFRFASPEQAAELRRQARIQRETMLLPDAAKPTDRARITGADLKRLAEMESAITQEIKVAPGDDVIDAFNRAQKLLKTGQPVRLRFAEGRYPLNKASRIRLGGGEARDPLLVIEGAGPDKTIFDFKGLNRKAPELLAINQKHHVIIRGLAMVNHPNTPVLVGKYAPVQDNEQFLIENCRFTSNRTGFTIFHVRGLTVRNVVANKNERTGLFVITVNALIEDSQFNENAGTGPGSFRGGIALAAFDTLIQRVQCNDNPGRASGIRMDHAAENIIIEDSEFNRNGDTGLVWETAAGPVDIVRSQMNDNKGFGIQLASAYHFSLIDSEVRRNGKAQAVILAKPRPVIFLKRGVKTGAYGASDLNAGIGKQWTNLRGLMGNRFLTVNGSTLETTSPRSPIYAHKYGKPDLYKTYFTEQFTASDNTYISPSDRVFDRFQGEYSKYDLINLDEWKAWTGQEKDSKLIRKTEP